MPTVRGIVRRAAADHYKFEALVLGIVESPQFRSKAQPPDDRKDSLARSVRGAKEEKHAGLNLLADDEPVDGLKKILAVG